MSNINIYNIRGLDICGFRDMADCLQHLFANHQLVTGMLIAVNAEKVVTIEQDASLFQLIKQADYRYADGISIVYSIRKKYPSAQISRIAGADLWEALMKRAGEEQIPVFLLGGKSEVLAETVRKVQSQWRVNVVGSHDGYFSATEQETLLTQIKQSGAKLVTVAMGSPKQERFMAACQHYYPDALYMGVGGTYDVFTGRVKRAPKLWRNWGLEWLYRLLAQPTRWQRQYKLLKYALYYYTGHL